MRYGLVLALARGRCTPDLLPSGAAGFVQRPGRTRAPAVAITGRGVRSVSTALLGSAMYNPLSVGRLTVTCCCRAQPDDVPLHWPGRISIGSSWASEGILLPDVSGL